MSCLYVPLKEVIFYKTENVRLELDVNAQIRTIITVVDTF
jgi:hypothetical protein